MPKHITSVKEIREVGILLKVGRPHIVRVLGALKVVPLPEPLPSKEALESRATTAVWQQYHDGKLAGEQEDPAAAPFHPRVPSLFITREGKAVFLKRDQS